MKIVDQQRENSSQTIVTEELRAAIGIESEGYVNEIERLAIRKYAEAIQDSNPIYVDEAYAKATPLRGIIAPPTFLCTMHAGEPKVSIPIPPSYTEGLNGGVEYIYERPVRLGDVLTGRSRLANVFEKDGRLGRMLFLIIETAFRDETGSLVARTIQTEIRYKRPEDSAAPTNRAPKSSSKAESEQQAQADVTRTESGPIELPDLLKPRYFEDVREGEQLPPLAKCPSQRHLVMYAGASGNYAEYHYDRDHALKLGMPGVILHGNLKIAYLGQLVTDWIGAYGSVVKLAARLGGMDLLGDTCVATGTVKQKNSAQDVGTVELELQSTAPDGRRTVTGTALVALPLRTLAG